MRDAGRRATRLAHPLPAGRLPSEKENEKRGSDDEMLVLERVAEAGNDA